MIIILLTLTFLLYSGYASLSYFEVIRESIWFIPGGLLLALLGNLCWLILARILKVPEDIFFYGIVFDLIVTFSFLLTPFILQKVNINGITILGSIILLIGLILIKVSLK